MNVLSLKMKLCVGFGCCWYYSPALVPSVYFATTHLASKIEDVSDDLKRRNSPQI